MGNFGETLKRVRMSKKTTLREVGEYIGKSIGYISDIEHDRKRPPDLETVSKIEDFLEVEDGSLLKLAKKIRKNMKPSLSKRLKQKPKLEYALLRAEKIYEDEDKLNELLEMLDKLEEE